MNDDIENFTFFYIKKSVMTTVLHKIIEKYYTMSRMTNSLKDYGSLPKIAGIILGELYEVSEMEDLDYISKTFLEAPFAIRHIINILRNEIHDSRQNLINKEFEYLINNKPTMEISASIDDDEEEEEEDEEDEEEHVGDTLHNIMSEIHNILEEESISEKEFEKQIAEQVSERLINSRMNGTLDMDSINFVSLPDHKDKIKEIHHRHKKGEKRHHVINEIFNDIHHKKYYKKHHHGLLEEDKAHLHIMHENLLKRIQTELKDVHKNIDAMGSTVFRSVEEAHKSVEESRKINIEMFSMLQIQHNFIENLSSVINELTGIVTIRIASVIPEIILKIENIDATIKEFVINGNTELFKSSLKVIRDNFLPNNNALIVQGVREIIQVMSNEIKYKIREELGIMINKIKEGNQHF